MGLLSEIRWQFSWTLSTWSRWKGKRRDNYISFSFNGGLNAHRLVWTQPFVFGLGLHAADQFLHHHPRRKKPQSRQRPVVSPQRGKPVLWVKSGKKKNERRRTKHVDRKENSVKVRAVFVSSEARCSAQLAPRSFVLFAANVPRSCGKLSAGCELRGDKALSSLNLWTFHRPECSGGKPPLAFRLGSFRCSDASPC